MSHVDPSSALRAAVSADDASAVLDLLQAGAAPLVAEPETGATALHLAAAGGRRNTVEALIQAGCDVGVQDYVSCIKNQQRATIVAIWSGKIPWWRYNSRSIATSFFSSDFFLVSLSSSTHTRGINF